MKKVLLLGAAVAAFSAVSAAQAADKLTLSVGGYANQWVGYAKNNAAQGKVKVDTQDDVEINFKGETKLDNGLTIGVEVDTDGSQGTTSRTNPSLNPSSNKNGKRSFTTVSGGFGSVQIGEQDNVGYLIHVSSPDVGGIGGQDGNWMNWIVLPGSQAESLQKTYAGDDKTSNKVIYVSPTFAGFTVGASYTPNLDPKQTGHTAIVSKGSSLYVYGVGYNKTYGDWTVKGDVGAGVGTIGDLRTYQGGLQVAYKNFTVGGSAIRRDTANYGTFRQDLAQGKSYDIGASYVTGPYGVSLTYFHGEAQKGTSQTDSDSVISLGGSYDVGPGVALKASVFHVKYDSDTAADKNSGTGVVTGVTVNF